MASNHPFTEPGSFVSDSGVDVTLTQGDSPDLPNTAGRAPFSKITKGVLFHKDSTTDEGDKKWASGVSTSSDPQPKASNPSFSSAAVHVEQQSGASDHGSCTEETAPPGDWKDKAQTLDSRQSTVVSPPADSDDKDVVPLSDELVPPPASTPPDTTTYFDDKDVLLLDSPPPGSFKNQMPTLDCYQSESVLVSAPHSCPTDTTAEEEGTHPPPESVLASPPLSSNPSDTTDDGGITHPSFTVGQPPLEEVNVDGSTDMVVERLEMTITGDAKKDKEKILRLEADLRQAEAEMTNLKEKLDSVTREKEQGQRELEKAKQEIERVKAEVKIDNEKMQKEHDAEVENLKKMIADVEKQKHDQKVEFCKEIQRLHDQLEKRKNKHHEEVVKLIKEKHELELQVREMKIEEGELKLKLSEACHNATKLQHELDLQKRDEAFSVFRSKSAEEMKQKDDEIRELKQRVSQLSLSSGTDKEENSEP